MSEARAAVNLGQLITFKRVDEAAQATFVDVDSSNSKHYYADGALALTGRYPITGNEMIFDAITFAGGLLESADPNDIRLVRPARGGKPRKIYTIDWEAVRAGKAEANLQIFPGDRLLVGHRDGAPGRLAIEQISNAARRSRPVTAKP